MNPLRIVLIAFAGVILTAAFATLFLLDWRASRATGRSLRASLPLVPSEAQRVYTDVRKSHTVESTKNQFEKVAARL